ncbi:MAG TPA: phosphodiester glycosidase family protein [Bacillota bacterium]|nr:phosphodiester glycosidase family protein [Bacillota bacterium]
MRRPWHCFRLRIHIAVCVIFLLATMTCSAEWVQITEGPAINQAKLIIDDSGAVLPVPVIVRGSTLLLPATFVAEVLEISMRYDPQAKRLSYSIPGGGFEVLLHQREWSLSSGEKRTFAEPPISWSGIPFVPVELLRVTGDYDISWDSRAMEIRLHRPGDKMTALTESRHGIHHDKVRIVFHLTREAPVKVMQMKNPPRVVIDFEDTRVQGALDSLIDHVAVERVRVTMTEERKTRAVIDLNYALPDVTTFWLQDPVRFVVDVPTVYSKKSALTIARGIRYITITNGTPQGPLTVDVLEIEMSDESIAVKTALAGPSDSFGVAPVSELVSSSGAIAGVNGVFYASDGTPLGLIIVDGRLRSLPVMGRTAMGITKDRRILIDNVSTDAGGNLVPNWLEEGVVYAVGGGPRLVKDGKVYVTAAQEQFKPDVAGGRAPRTGVGVTYDGNLLLVAVTGRQAYHSIGVTLEELANIMLELGAKDAMNLDGGGSSTMVVRDFVMNTPSDGRERKVADAILVFSDVSGAAPMSPEIGR